MSNALFRKKSIDRIQKEYDRGQEDGQPMNLKKVLTVRDLTFMGVAAVIGAGIFSTIGKAAFEGGPGVIFLFLITAVTCGFTALCYAEFASRVPVSGSAYTYSYVTFGELIAWVIGWALILEYAIGNIVVAISWSAYFNNLLIGMHIHLPDWLTIGYQTAKIKYDSAAAAGLPLGDLVYSHAPTLGPLKFIINLPAFLIVVIITILAYIGISESKKSANFMVGLKLVLLAFIVVFGFYLIIADGSSDNWSPFLPNGMEGVLRGVSSVFFAYIGFDAISTTAEECKNPRRDMPKGMLYSLLICTVIYILVALVITGLVNYKEFEGVADPLAYVFNKINMPKVGLIIAVSAVAASTSVLLVFQIGQPRIWMSMSRDGLLPKRFARVSKRYKTPAFATVITGLLVGIPTLFIDDLLMTDLTSIGTLFAFVLVCSGVLVLPKVTKAKDQFKLPYISARYLIPIFVAVFIYFFRARLAAAFMNLSTESYEEILFILFILVSVIAAILSFVKRYSLIPVLGTLCCLYLMITIPAKSWLVFFGWMAVGLLVYFAYGYRHSRLKKTTE